MLNSGSVLRMMGALLVSALASATALAAQKAVDTDEQDLTVVQCWTIDSAQAPYSLTVARNSGGLFNIHVQDAKSGASWRMTDWAGSFDDSYLNFYDPSVPSAGLVYVHWSEADQDYKAQMKFQNIDGLQMGRVGSCVKVPVVKPVLSCINNILNAELNAITIYPQDANFVMLVQYLHGYASTIPVTGDVQTQLSGQGWSFSAPFNYPVWMGHLYDPNGKVDDMVCFH